MNTTKPLLIDCRNALQYQELAKHCWVGFESCTISALMLINRQTGGDVLDVLNGLIDAEIELNRHLDWKVSAAIVETDKPPELVIEDNQLSVELSPEGGVACITLILRVSDAEGRLVTYLTPKDLDQFGQSEWCPAWSLTDLANARAKCAKTSNQGEQNG